jgi:hypothetical protein
VHGKLVVLDLRERGHDLGHQPLHGLRAVPAGNISIHVMWGVQQQNTVLATGKSILDRSSKTNVGELMLAYRRRRPRRRGTCQVANDKAMTTLRKLIRKINRDG